MVRETSIKLFEQRQVRSLCDDEKEKWFFSIIDIVGLLTDQLNYKKAQSYWTTLKNRLKKKEVRLSQIVTN